VFKIFCQYSQIFSHERNDTKIIRAKRQIVLMIKLTKTPNCHAPNGYFCILQFTIAQLLAQFILMQVSLVRYYRRGLRENLKHKIRTSTSSGANSILDLLLVLLFTRLVVGTK
jgi:hypothetical protein